MLDGISYDSPLVYQSTEMLKRLEQETVTLDDLLRLSAHAPALPNVSNILSDIGADQELQQIWLSACYPLETHLIVPRDDLRSQIRLNIAHIVEVSYPHLVNRVSDAILRLLSDSVHPSSSSSSAAVVTVFHFVGIFKGRHFPSYIENLGHDAWMISLLDTRQPSKVVQVFDRLSQVPVVPPLDSLRHMAMLLCHDEQMNTCIIERYLLSARGQLLSDLLSSFLCLLEAEPESARIGALRALSIMKNPRTSKQVAAVARSDQSERVRKEAELLLSALSQTANHRQSRLNLDEMTRI